GAGRGPGGRGRRDAARPRLGAGRAGAHELPPGALDPGAEAPRHVPGLRRSRRRGQPLLQPVRSPAHSLKPPMEAEITPQSPAPLHGLEAHGAVLAGALAEEFGPASVVGFGDAASACLEALRAGGVEALAGEEGDPQLSGAAAGRGFDLAVWLPAEEPSSEEGATVLPPALAGASG